MKRNLIIILVIILAIAITGCTKKKAEEVIKPEEEMMIIEEEPTEELEIIEETVIEEEPVIEEPVLEYKVQLFATYDEMKANKVVSDLAPKFSDEVYVEYIAPYYKVRMGRYATKEEAEMARNMAREKGYADAFIVLP